MTALGWAAYLGALTFAAWATYRTTRRALATQAEHHARPRPHTADIDHLELLYAQPEITDQERNTRKENR